MKKSTIIFAAIIVFLVLVVISWALVSQVKKTKPLHTTEMNISPTSVIFVTPASTTGTLDNSPQPGADLQKQLDAFPPFNDKGDKQLITTNTYTIVYEPLFQRFMIQLTVPDSRQAAENSFLGILHVTKQQACQLAVIVTSHNTSGEEEVTPLSYCTPQ